MLDLAAKPSPANDMALIYSFAKINDPNSVVRESEFASAAKVGTYGQAVQVAANKVANGEMLTPAQRADFLNAAGNQYQSSETQWVNGVVAAGAEASASLRTQLGQHLQGLPGPPRKEGRTRTAGSRRG